MGIILLMLFLMLIYIMISTFYVVINTVNISSGFDGLLKIAHISDIHGCTKYLNGSLSEMINKCDVDYVIITGDLANNKI